MNSQLQFIQCKPMVIFTSPYYSCIYINDCLVFNQVIPLKMFYCMLLIPGVKLLMLPRLLWLGFWTWLRPLTVLIMIFFQTSWLIMVLWVVIIATQFESYLCGHQQAVKFDDSCLLGVLLKLVYHKDQYWDPYCFLSYSQLIFIKF